MRRRPRTGESWTSSRAARFEAQSRADGFVRADVKPYRPARRCRDQRRQRLHGGSVLQQPAAGQQIAARGAGQAKRLEHVAQHLGRDGPLPSGDVVPLDRDTGAAARGRGSLRHSSADRGSSMKAQVQWPGSRPVRHFRVGKQQAGSRAGPTAPHRRRDCSPASVWRRRPAASAPPPPSARSPRLPARARHPGAARSPSRATR